MSSPGERALSMACAVLAAGMSACGEAPTTFDDASTVLSEASPDLGYAVMAGPFDESMSPDVEESFWELADFEAALPQSPIDKALGFDDPTLSCVAIPSRTCPGVTLRMANRRISFRDSVGGFSLALNPPVPVQQVGRSGGMRARVDLNSITCGLTGGVEQVFTEEVEMRLPTETRLEPVDDDERSAKLDPPGRASNYPQAGTLVQFSCANARVGVLAPGFDPRVVSAPGRYISSRSVTDAQTRRDGTARFFLRCGYRLDLDAIFVERERPRDVLSVSGSRFVLGEALSSAERTRRCSAMCQDDCAVQFGADALGAEACKQPCTTSCVSRSIRNVDQCPPAPPSCGECQTASDCGSPSAFSCISGCCIQVPL